jgi:hypothetical protein
MRKLALVLGVAALALTVVGAAAAKVRISATLNAGQEVPKQTVKVAAAHGTFSGTLVGTKLTWKLTFAKLSGPAAAAHIHLGKPGKANPAPAVALCGPCTNGQTGTATISAALLKTIKKNGAYVNVHTAKNPAGEIRGQLVAKG